MEFRSRHRIIQEGDIVSLDAGVIYKGYHSDAARTHAVGEVSEEAKKLIQSYQRKLFRRYKICRKQGIIYLIYPVRSADMQKKEVMVL